MSERNPSTALASHSNFYDLASVGYVSLNEQGLVLATNLTAAALMGIPRDDLVKQPISRFIFPEDYNIYAHHAGQLLETGIPQVYDLRMRKMDGTQFWAHLVAASAHNDDGSPMCHLVVSDITEHKRIADELLESRANFAAFMEHLPGFAYMKDGQGRHTFVNKALEQLFGVGREGWLGKTFEQLISLPGAEKIRVVDEAVLASKSPRMEEETTIESGQKHTYLSSKFPIRQTDGSLALGGISLDITERKQAEEAQRESAAKYRMLVDTMSEGLGVQDKNGLITFMNPRACKMLGYELEELIGKSTSIVFDEENQKLLRDQMAGRRSGVRKSYEIVWRRKDGGKVNTIVAPCPLFDENGDYTGSVAVFTDITARKQAEEAQRVTAAQLAAKVEELERMQARLIETERLQAMGQMAVGVAHDFNNALMKALGQAQLMRLALEQGPVAAALQGVAGGTRLLECLARQEQAVHDAAETVRKIRGATRPRDSEAFESVSLGEIVEQVLATTKPRWKNQAEAAGVQITVQTALANTPPVLGNPAELREALTNLIFNALDAMPQGGTLTITTRQVSGSEIDETRAPDPGALIPDPGTKSLREWVELSVTDTGVGMPPAVQARLFEPFFTTKGVRGTGLGLSMVKGIISRHDGEVTVQSAVGQGTTITLRLPVTEVAAEVVPPPTAHHPLSSSLNLLVIDDEPLLAEMLGDLLGVLGHTAATVTSGEEGLTRLAAERFDLVLTDLGMPGMSGWEVAQAVKIRWPQLPVILVTGWGDAVEDDRHEGTGVDLILAKPYTVAQLKHALAQGVAHTWRGGATDLKPDRLPPSNV